MFLRKEGLSLLPLRFPDGSVVPYWNTFYQRVWEENGERRYLGQMDLIIRSPLVWEFYRQTLQVLAGYGAAIVRLDAFAYAPKAPGRRNSLNEPETWQLLEKVAGLARRYGLTLLPELHVGYGGHKQINRTNLTHEYLKRRLAQSVVRRQLELLRFRATCPALDFDSDVRIEAENGKMRFRWVKNGYTAQPFPITFLSFSGLWGRKTLLTLL